MEQLCFPFLAVVQFSDFVCCLLLYTSLQPRKDPLICVLIVEQSKNYLRLFVSQTFAMSSWLMGYRKIRKVKGIKEKQNTMKCINAVAVVASVAALISLSNPESWNGVGTVVLVHICRRIRRLAAPSS